jgi:hypothetical protein
VDQLHVGQEALAIAEAKHPPYFHPIPATPPHFWKFSRTLCKQGQADPLALYTNVYTWQHVKLASNLYIVDL